MQKTRHRKRYHFEGFEQERPLKIEAKTGRSKPLYAVEWHGILLQWSYDQGFLIATYVLSF